MKTINPVIRCSKHSNGKHQWHRREKLDTKGRTIVGFVCACGAVDYIDLI